MTGSLAFNRQHSSAADSSNVNPRVRPKYRRWSSADNHDLFEIVSDDNQNKELSPLKRKETSSDTDSGVEDLDQQGVNHVSSPTDNTGEEETSINFGACDDKQCEEHPITIDTERIEDPKQAFLNQVHHNLIRAGKVSDNIKKDICQNTMEVFHAEFSRRLYWPILLQYPNIRYHLFAEDEVLDDPCTWPGCAFLKLDNAKAQFQCPNIYCQHLWTSARARISFKISQPQHDSFVVLKIYGQNCRYCETPANALWYTEEVCRVMKNLTKSMIAEYFPTLDYNDDLQDEQMIENTSRSSRMLRHDPHQRQGKMGAPHNTTRCEACQYNLCFA